MGSEYTDAGYPGQGYGAAGNRAVSPGTEGVRRRRSSRGSFGTAGNFARMAETFGTVGGAGAPGAPGAAGTATLAPQPRAPLAPPGWAFHEGAWWQWSPAAGQWVAAPDAPPAYRPPVSDTRALTTSSVLDKVLLLTALATISGGAAAWVKLPIGAAVALMVAALVLGLVASFVPRTARVLAPWFAAAQGGVLGVLSRLASTQTHDIAPMAIVGTSAVFFGVLFAYRSGLVKVGRKFIIGTFVAGWTLLALMIASMLGMTLPDLGQVGTGVVVFGVLYLFVAIADLFVDLEFIRRAEVAGVSADAEWYAAFATMAAVMMVYLALLRILSGRR